MRVKMKATAAGPDGTYQEGQICEVPEALAEAFVSGGYAEPVEKQAAKTENAAELEGDLKKLNGGYYELPNGEKVRGKSKAEAALAELKASEEAEPVKDTEDATAEDADASEGEDTLDEIVDEALAATEAE